MSNIVNLSFFVGDINIPNTGQPAVGTRVTEYINKYEPECLLKLLGYPLYKVFGSETSQRMADLLDGVEYVDYEGYTQYWKGLKHDTTQSLIAYYIFYHWLKDTHTQVIGMGTTSVNKGDGSVVVIPMERMVSTWNSFSEEGHECLAFLWNQTDIYGYRVYPEFTSYQFQKSWLFSGMMNTFAL